MIETLLRSAGFTGLKKNANGSFDATLGKMLFKGLRLSSYKSKEVHLKPGNPPVITVPVHYTYDLITKKRKG